MYKNRIKKYSINTPSPTDEVLSPCVNLGTRIHNQMYHGVDSSNSTLITGQFDDEDDWNIDPACDMNTDRFEFSSKPVERVPDTPPAE